MPKAKSKPKLCAQPVDGLVCILKPGHAGECVAVKCPQCNGKARPVEHKPCRRGLRRKKPGGQPITYWVCDRCEAIWT